MNKGYLNDPKLVVEKNVLHTATKVMLDSTFTKVSN